VGNTLDSVSVCDKVLADAIKYVQSIPDVYSVEPGFIHNTQDIVASINSRVQSLCTKDETDFYSVRENATVENLHCPNTLCTFETKVGGKYTLNEIQEVFYMDSNGQFLFLDDDRNIDSAGYVYRSHVYSHRQYKEGYLQIVPDIHAVQVFATVDDSQPYPLQDDIFIVSNVGRKALVFLNREANSYSVFVPSATHAQKWTLSSGTGILHENRGGELTGSVLSKTFTLHSSSGMISFQTEPVRR
jgi:hypothetical protein